MSFSVQNRKGAIIGSVQFLLIPMRETSKKRREVHGQASLEAALPRVWSRRICVCAPYKRKEGGKERTREKEKKRNAKRMIEEGNEREAKRKPLVARASGACSLLPDDRVHRLFLVVGAPKSRIFDDRAVQRDLLFH